MSEYLPGWLAVGPIGRSTIVFAADAVRRLAREDAVEEELPGLGSERPVLGGYVLVTMEDDAEFKRELAVDAVGSELDDVEIADDEDIIDDVSIPNVLACK